MISRPVSMCLGKGSEGQNCCATSEKYTQGQTEDPGLLTLSEVLHRSGLSSARGDKVFKWAQNKLGPSTGQDQHLVLCEAGQYPGLRAVLAPLCWFGTGFTWHHADTESLTVPTSLLPSRATACIARTAMTAPSHEQHSKYETSTPKNLHLENLSWIG